MADDATRLQVLIEGNTKNLESALKRLEGITNESFKRQGKSVESLTKQIEQVRGTVERAGRVFGIVFGAREIIDFVKSNIEAGKAIAENAEKIGLTAEAFQSLDYAAKQAGVSTESLQAGFKGMTVFVGNLERGVKAAKTELADLGLTLADIKGKSPDQVFTLLLDRVGKIRDPLIRNAEALKIFGKTSAELMPLATLGATGIDALRQKAVDLGLVLSNETIAKAKEAGDKITDIGAAAQVAGVNMAAQFLPAIDALHDLVTSQAFQDGMVGLAKNIGSIVEFIAKLDPHVLQLLLSAAAGYAVAGPAGAAAGAAFNAGTQIGDAAISAAGQAVGTEKSPKGDRLGPDPGRQRFDNSLYPPGNTGKAALVAALNKQEDTGGGGITDQTAQAALDAAKKKYEALADAIGLQTTNLKASTREQYKNNEAAKLGADATPEQIKQIKQLAGALYDAQKAQKAFNDATDYFAQTAYDAFDSLITGAKSFSDVLVDVIKKLEQAVFQALLLGQGPLAGLFGTGPTGSSGIGGFFGAMFGGGRAVGGPVNSGTPYMVGERGPELFVPKTSGMIVPDVKQGYGGGGSSRAAAPIINIHNHGADVSTRHSQSSDGRNLIEVIINAVKGDMAQGGFDGPLLGRFGARVMPRRLTGGMG